jgi:hypothetical protein
VQAHGEVRNATAGTDTTKTTITDKSTPDKPSHSTTSAADTDRAPARAARDEGSHEPSAPAKTSTDQSTADKGADTN